jgi:hypothetical protein
LIPDYSVNWPNMDNIVPGVKNIEGIYPVNYMSDWVIGKTMSLQFRIQTEGSETLSLYKLNSSGTYSIYATISPVNITPYGWESEKINRYNYEFLETGVYYFESASAGYRSIKFVVHSELKFRKKLIQVEYSNSFNDYGMVFYDNNISRYLGLAYFTGQLLLGTPGNSISAIHSDRENVVKLRSTPFRVATLKFSDIHYADIDRINMIFACDTIKVNGIDYQNEEIGDAQQISALEVSNMSIKLYQTNFDYNTI